MPVEPIELAPGEIKIVIQVDQDVRTQRLYLPEGMSADDVKTRIVELPVV